MNVLLKSTHDSTPPVTVLPATVSECNCIINSELFLSTITLSTVIEHSISEKWDLHSFSIFIVMTVIGTKSFCSSKECNRDSNSSGRNCLCEVCLGGSLRCKLRDDQ